MARQPNLLLLMTDQQRWDALGCVGGWVETPNLDALAAEGLRFANAVTTSPLCIPARWTMATGHYPHVSGVWNNNGPHALPPETPTWMQALRAAGYRTSLFGKTHLHAHQGDLRDREALLHAYGLDDVNEIGGPRASARCRSHLTELWERRGLWAKYQEDYRERFARKPHVVRPSVLPLELYADCYVGARACEYLESYERKEPWFCWVSFGGPHEPWDAPEPYASRYDPEAMPAPAPVPESLAARPRGVLDRKLEKGVPGLSPEDIRALRANYAGNVTLIDDWIGKIFETIKRRGEWEHTVIAFTSDHGEMNGDAGLIYKSNFLNGAVRVPLLLRTPEGAASGRAGSVCETPVEWFDVGPTLVECAGASLAQRQFARSLLPLMKDPAAPHRGEALSELHDEAMLLTEEWKMAVNREGECYLLFDRQNDPGESKNLAARPEYAAVETRLRLRLLERILQAQRHAP